MSSAHKAQKIGRLTPLKDVLERIAAEISPVAGREIALAEALGRVLAADVVAKANHPAKAISLRDGFAVRAEDTSDASSYAPAPLTKAKAVQVGDAMPADADAVAVSDGVTKEGNAVAAITAVAAGDGVLAASADVQAGKPLRKTGEKLRQIDLATLQALGVKTVNARVPRVRVVAAKTSDMILDAAASLAKQIVVAASGDVVEDRPSDLRVALSSGGADFIIVVGGSGMGERDAAIATLQDIGHLHFHGIGIAPGETSALGFVDGVPVLIVAGRIDATFAALVTMGDAILARLSGRRGEVPAMTVTLARKVVSTIGLVEIVPVQLQDSGAMPLANGYLPMQAMMRADGYIVVPADSEGFPAGSVVAMRTMP